MKPKLAILFESSPFDRKGMFNAIHEKVKRLVADGTFQVEAFCIHSRDNAFTRRVRHTPECEKVDSVTVEGVTYHILWYPFTITDHILTEILSCKPLFFNEHYNKVAPFYLYVNVTTPEILRKVLANPEKYAPSGVYIMRIHGTFVNFLDLSAAIQQDIITRLDLHSTHC